MSRQRAPVVCQISGCPNVTVGHTGRCAQHARQDRWAAGQSGYQRSGWQWQKTRERILQRDGRRCYLCGGPASTADHIIPVAWGGSQADSNLAAVCKPCHDAKTARQRRGPPRGAPSGARDPDAGRTAGRVAYEMR